MGSEVSSLLLKGEYGLGRESDNWLRRACFAWRVRHRANPFTFPEHLSCDNNAEFCGFLAGQRVRALTQYLET